MILVDSSVWSLAFRRRRKDLNPEERLITFELRDLIVSGETCLIGPIRQEVLSGLHSEEEFRDLRTQLDFHPGLALTDDVWDLAAEYFNLCRSRGISPDAIDMTICAAAHTHNTPIFTTDPDFKRYARHLPITLHHA